MPANIVTTLINIDYNCTRICWFANVQVQNSSAACYLILYIIDTKPRTLTKYQYVIHTTPVGKALGVIDS